MDEFLVRRSGEFKYEILRKRDIRPESSFHAVISWFKSSKKETNEYGGLLPTEDAIEAALEAPTVLEHPEESIPTVLTQISFQVPEISLKLIAGQVEKKKKSMRDNSSPV